jgi:hypothetical protein
MTAEQFAEKLNYGARELIYDSASPARLYSVRDTETLEGVGLHKARPGWLEFIMEDARRKFPDRTFGIFYDIGRKREEKL